MQHNGLRVRRKQKYHTTEITCSHGCSGTETVTSFLGMCGCSTATLYPIWIHRNHRIFQHVQSSTLYIRGRAIAYTKLHLTRIITVSTCPKLTRLSHQVLHRLEDSR
ncbi:hypothetical protein PsorP6_005814 [Peronosclerospora sorghi]|uniref:Uncharacterized protein n=1 Tax=Peronosclerospora sorghi TaxID=230839 RepID=A0ACC0W507_9STRA|nr:hypothetical protein PsorP6_005814 [Peronosclerospora sorghi]